MVSTNNVINKTVGATISGVTNTFTITNASNTASSAARQTIVVGGGSAADPTLNFNVSGVTNWEMGIDNSVNDNLTISQGTALGTNDVWRMTTAGIRTMPLQPSFWAGAGGAQNNVTGDATNYTIVFSSEQFDQGNNFDGTSTFTAPVTGKYFFYATTTLQNISAAHNKASLFFYKNGASVQALNLGNVGVFKDAANNYSVQASAFINLTAADTVTVVVQVAGGAKTINLLNDIAETKFTGYLVC